MPKGMKGFQRGHKRLKRTTKGDFKKGQHASPKTEFKKGNISTSCFKKGHPSIFKGKKRLNISGKNHYNWKNGKRKCSGYIYLYKPNHPNAKINYVKRADLVMESKIGRYLKPNEITHHKNNIRNDDRPENLRLFANRSLHRIFHIKNKN